MSDLKHTYSETSKRWRCFSANLGDWVCLSGYGDTKEEAEIAFFKISIAKDNENVNNNTTQG